MYFTNQRLLIDSDICTVRFIGHIPQWDQLALGVEWDNPARGKHDGSLDGVHYFTCAPGSGSFVKATNKKIQTGRDLAHVLISRYNDPNAAIDHLQFGSKAVESYGFDKLNRLQANWASLVSVSLDKTGIDRLEGELPPLPSLRHLDLSYNLFGAPMVGDWLADFPLESLNLNGNKLGGDFALSRKLSISELRLCDTQIGVDALVSLLPFLPNLQSLHLASNRYSSTESLESNMTDKSSESNMTDKSLESNMTEDSTNKSMKLPISLKVLDLSFNEFSFIPNVDSETLVLSDNRIAKIEGFFPNTTSVDLRYNLIESWNEIDRIRSVFPKLTSLKFTDNPICKGYTDEEVAIQLIARVGPLSYLNGSTITQDEVKNSELFFISQVRSGNAVCPPGRWKQLLEKHGIEDYSIEKGHSSNKVRLVVNGVPRTFLRTNSVLRLMGIVSKQTGLSILEFDVYHYVGEEELGVRVYMVESHSLDYYGLGEGQHIYVKTVSNSEAS